MTAAIAPLAPRLGTVEVGLAMHLRKHSHQPAGKIEGQEAQRIHGVFDFRAERPQEHHVADDVGPTAVQEHRGKNCDPVMTGDYVCGNNRPFQDKGVPMRQFGYKHQSICRYDQCRHSREVCGAP